MRRLRRDGWLADAAGPDAGTGLLQHPLVELAHRRRADLDVRPGPRPPARRLTVDRVAVGMVHAGVGRVEAPLDIDDVTVGVRGHPVQVGRVVITELLHALHTASGTGPRPDGADGGDESGRAGPGDFLCCGYGAGPGGHGVVDGPDAARIGLVPARGGHAREAAAVLRPAVPPGRGGRHLLRAARGADRGHLGGAHPGRVHLQRQGVQPVHPAPHPASRHCPSTCARRRRRRARSGSTSRTSTPR